MIHAICDFCGKDCDRNATLLTMTPFQDFARYNYDTKPYGNVDKPVSLVMCHECREKHGLPNPMHTYTSITSQKLSYEKCLDNYTKDDIKNDIKLQNKHKK